MELDKIRLRLFNITMCSLGFASIYDSELFTKTTKVVVVLLLLYIYIIITRSDVQRIAFLEDSLQ